MMMMMMMMMMKYDGNDDELTAKANNGKYTSIKHKYENIPIPINITINAIDLFFANIL